MSCVFRIWVCSTGICELQTATAASMLQEACCSALRGPWPRGRAAFAEATGVRTGAMDVVWPHDDLREIPVVLEVSPIFDANPPPPPGWTRPSASSSPGNTVAAWLEPLSPPAAGRVVQLVCYDVQG